MDALPCHTAAPPRSGNVWGPEIERYINDVAKDAAKRRRMHLDLARAAVRKTTVLSFIGITTGFCSGVCSALATVFHSNAAESMALTVSASMLGLLSGTVAAISRYGNYKDLGDVNKQAAAYYFSLQTSAQTQLCVQPEHRLGMHAFVDWVHTRYMDILAAAPVVSPRTRRKYAIQEVFIGGDAVVDVPPGGPARDTWKRVDGKGQADSAYGLNVNTASRNAGGKGSRSKSQASPSDQMLGYEIQRLLAHGEGYTHVPSNV